MKKKLFLVLSALSLVLSYQACSKVVNSTPAPVKIESLQLASSGNGEGYEGKLGRYEYSDPQQPCLEVGRNGKHLPNAQIFTYSAGGIYLVRQKCIDISPVALKIQDIIIIATNQISYSGIIYNQQPNIGDFDLLAAECPAGKVAKANSTHSNLFSSSQEMNTWQVHAGVTVSPEGSLGSLPLYSILRNDPALAESFRRAEQILPVVAGQLYAFSFYAKPDSNQKIRLMSWNGTVTHNLQMNFDLSNGNAQVVASDGISQLSSTSRVFADGIFFTVYFSPDFSADVDIGIAADSATLGVKVFATAVQLDLVANFCTP